MELLAPHGRYPTPQTLWNLKTRNSPVPEYAALSLRGGAEGAEIGHLTGRFPVEWSPRLALYFAGYPLETVQKHGTHKKYGTPQSLTGPIFLGKIAMSNSILDEIVASKRREVAAA